MKIKMRKVLTDKQMYRTKWNIGIGAFFIICYLGSQFFVDAAEDNWQLKEDGGDYYVSKDVIEFDKGKIYYYSSNVEVCNR